VRRPERAGRRSPQPGWRKVFARSSYQGSGWKSDSLSLPPTLSLEAIATLAD